MKTYSAKPQDITRDWYVIDANDKVLGRLASAIAHRLRGDRVNRRERVFDAVVQLVDEHPGPDFTLLVFAEIDERCKILNDVTARIANRADEERGQRAAGNAQRAARRAGRPLSGARRRRWAAG